MSHEEIRLVQVYRAWGEMEAMVVKGLLESHGIPVIFKSNAAPSILGFTVDGLGEYKLMVAEADAGNATDLINERDKVNITGEPDFPEQTGS